MTEKKVNFAHNFCGPAHKEIVGGVMDDFWMENMVLGDRSDILTMDLCIYI